MCCTSKVIGPKAHNIIYINKVLSTQVPIETNKQEYRITRVHRINANKGVVCHKQNYAYAVFYCHEIHDAGTYMVPLVSADGRKVNAIAVKAMVPAVARLKKSQMSK